MPGFDGLYSVRYWLPSWLELVIKPNIQRAFASGFDGIFLDAATDFQWSAGNPLGNPVNPNGNQDMAALLINAADYAHRLNPAAIVIPNNIQRVLAANFAVADHVDGGVVESGWWRQFEPAPEPFSEFIARDWEPFQSTGKRVFSVDYVPRGRVADQLAYADWALRHNFVPELTDSLQTAAALTGHPVLSLRVRRQCHGHGRERQNQHPSRRGAIRACSGWQPGDELCDLRRALIRLHHQHRRRLCDRGGWAGRHDDVDWSAVHSLCGWCDGCRWCAIDSGARVSGPKGRLRSPDRRAARGYSGDHHHYHHTSGET